MNPPKKNMDEDGNATGPKQFETFTNDQLLRVWKEYSLKIKRDNKGSLYSTLFNAKPKLGSDLNISIDVASDLAAREFDQYKPEFINFLRRKLKNSNINVTYKVAEVTAVREFSDNKSKFAKLKEENPSLEKFRKLFSLDIEF